MKPHRAIDPVGVQLDAEFHIAPGPSGFDILIESRSGRTRGGLARNPDYEHLLELLLRRAANLGATLVGAWVESEHTAQLDAAQRQLNVEALPFPIDLSSVTDFRTFRVMLSRPQGGIGRREGATGPGNRNKRIRLSFETGESCADGDLTDAIIFGQVKHADADITSELHDEQGRPRELLDLATIQAILQRYEYASPTVRQRVARQIERGPIGELVKDANGRCCQICVALGYSRIAFRLRNGKHYVEAHHVELVSSQAIGVLRVSNVVTLCANHHRELHFGAEAVVIDDGEQFIVTVEQGTVRIDKAKIGSLTVQRLVK